jgi:hypothetical protein
VVDLESNAYRHLPAPLGTLTQLKVSTHARVHRPPRLRPSGSLLCGLARTWGRDQPAHAHYKRRYKLEYAACVVEGAALCSHHTTLLNPRARPRAVALVRKSGFGTALR